MRNVKVTCHRFIRRPTRPHESRGRQKIWRHLAGRPTVGKLANFPGAGNRQRTGTLTLLVKNGAGVLLRLMLYESIHTDALHPLDSTLGLSCWHRERFFHPHLLLLVGFEDSFE